MTKKIYMPVLAQIEQLRVNVAICDDIDLADTSNDSPSLFEMKILLMHHRQ